MDELAQTIFETSRTPLLVLERTGTIVSANRAYLMAFEVTHSEVIGSNFYEILRGAFDVPELRRTVDEGGGTTDFVVAVVVPFRGKCTFTVNARKLGELVLASLEDSTDRTRSIEELLKAKDLAEKRFAVRTQRLAEIERRLSSFTAHLPGIAYRAMNDASLTMKFVSPGCRELLGYAPEDLIDHKRVSYVDLIHPDDRTAAFANSQAGLAEGGRFQREYRVRTRDGDEKVVWEQGAGVFDSSGRLIAIEGIITDITARKKAEQDRENLERQMRATQRMEAVGRLAGGIAHDFNNLLTVVQSYANFLLEALPRGAAQISDVRVILDASERAARLTNQLLAFSRRQIQELQVVDLNEMVASLDKMLRRVIGENVQLIVDLDPDLGRVKADVSQIEQVLMNLALNARDAMPKGGRLTIETRNARLDSDYLTDKSEPGVSSGRYVMIAVTDTGIGMDPETQSRIFEPFFTTKSKDKGTGLGLSTVFGIIKQSGGYIWCYSEVGRGTTFKIYLPRTDAETSRDLKPVVAPEVFEGNAKILLVEDEALVRRAAARILRKHGYEVLEAPNGEEAWTLCVKHGESIDLLITDIVLPKMDGPELARRATKIHPDMRVLFTSGYAEGALVGEGVVGEEGSTFLSKPFTPESLLGKIQTALERPALQR
jgi:two-component system, cell cycle sensor histidine kinase and response regulator CckA